jgi:oligoribonuclease NrnB/cAMP/cGMP phosphodiesterase (DHH superfamily)
VVQEYSKTLERKGPLNILIYHHYDQDGYLAASVANLFLNNHPYNRIVFRVGKHDDKHDEEAMAEADAIYVLDYVFPKELMQKYYDRIVWIDHHQSSMTEIKVKVEIHHSEPIKGLRRIGTSGCLLTWEYFINSEFRDRVAKQVWYTGEVPLVLEMVNDRDVWNWEFGDETAAFHEASAMFLREYSEWENHLKMDKLTRKSINSGKQLLSFIRKVVDNYNKSFSWEGWFEGHRVAFLNGSSMISGELHRRLRDDHPSVAFVVAFMFRQDKVTVGLYRNDKSNQVKLGIIAGKYGGGGHEGAAGFKTSHEEWVRILNKSGTYQ